MLISEQELKKMSQRGRDNADETRRQPEDVVLLLFLTGD